MKKKISRWYYNILFALVGVDVGPIMVRHYNSWLYIDPYGDIYRVSPTHQTEIPLAITLVHKG